MPYPFKERVPDPRIGHVALIELVPHLRETCPGASEYPSIQQLRNAGYSGIFRTKRISGRVYLALDQVPLVVEHFRLDQQLIAAD